MLPQIKSSIRRAFYRSAFFRKLVGITSIFVGRTSRLGISHLESYAEGEAIGPLQRDEAMAIFGIVRVLRPRTIVEFGFFHGHSAFNFLCAMEPDARIFSYDISDEAASRARDEFSYDLRLKFLQKSQTDFCPADIDHRQVDVVFFDAAHDLELNKQTWTKLLPSLGENAIVLVHDTGLWNREHFLPLHHRFVQESGGEWHSDQHFAHAPGERGFIDWVCSQESSFAAIHLHSTNTLRHGLTILQKQRRLAADLPS